MQSFFEKEDLNEDRYFHQNEDIPKYHVNRSSHELENRKRTTYYIYACVCDTFIVFIIIYRCVVKSYTTVMQTQGDWKVSKFQRAWNIKGRKIAAAPAWVERCALPILR